jgi:serine protease Do
MPCKPRRLLAAALAAALSGCAGGPFDAAVAGERREPPATFAAALARGLPSTVGVYGVRLSTSDTRGDDDARAHIGAGFFISADGLIATAAHVLADSPQIIVKLQDQRVLVAEFVGADVESDIALIRVPVTLAAPPAFGASGSLRAGDWVLAVGEPYGIGQAVVAGIVGGRGRHFAEDSELLFIQTDLALNPGNSGGPLLDVRGNIVGMNLRTVVGSFGSPGLSLSAPIEVVRQIAAELASQGHVSRPRLGASFEDVTPLAAVMAGRAYAQGALIGSVSEGSVAQRLGLREGDIVVGMNGRAIGDSADLARVLLGWRSEHGTQVTVFRDGHVRQLMLQ